MSDTELRDENTQRSDADSLASLRMHPVYRLAVVLAEYLGLERDFIAFMELLSLVAGAMGIAINLDIATDELAVDSGISNRISAIAPRAIAAIDTYQQFKTEERNGFSDRAVILVRPGTTNLYRKIERCTAQSLNSDKSGPSVWRIVSGYDDSALTFPTLRLVGRYSERRLNSFAEAFTTPPNNGASRARLAEIVKSAQPGVKYECTFRKRFIAGNSTVRTALDPISMLILERMLQVFAHLRCIMTESQSEDFVTLEDYEAVRVLLIHLPLVPLDRAISAQALETATCIYRAIETTGHQLALPDRSNEGYHWFTRKHAISWTGLGYTTVKKYLAELEGDGMIISTVDRNNRQHGRIIHYRFTDSRAPPFAWKNPFEQLPSLAHMSQGH